MSESAQAGITGLRNYSTCRAGRNHTLTVIRISTSIGVGENWAMLEYTAFGVACFAIHASEKLRREVANQVVRASQNIPAAG
jgi:hypothetical protein